MKIVFSFITIVCLGLASSSNIEYPGDRAGDYRSYQSNVKVSTSPIESSLELVHQETITSKDATFISVHFSKFHLPNGHFVVVRSPSSSEKYEYRNLGRGSLGLSPSGFFATHIKGSKAIIEYFKTSSEAVETPNNYGYSIDKFSHGLVKFGGREAICGKDNSLEAKCYKDGNGTSPEVYKRSRAVVRLLIEGMWFCTGWLVGCEGHLMTNHHCISSQTKASNTDYEFDAEGESCDTDCREELSCKGSLTLDSSLLIEKNKNLDYGLVKLNTSHDVNAEFGYLKLRESGPELNERIYIPQHPSGWGKRIAMVVDDGNYTTIEAMNLSHWQCGDQMIGYMADTMGGSSGSPVIGYRDHKVVGLHNCANCHNKGHRINRIIDDLRKKNVLPRCATKYPPFNPITPKPTTEAPTSAPTTPPPSTPVPTTLAPTPKPTDPVPKCEWSFKKFKCEPKDLCKWSFSKLKCIPKSLVPTQPPKSSTCKWSFKIPMGCQPISSCKWSWKKARCVSKHE